MVERQMVIPEGTVSHSQTSHFHSQKTRQKTMGSNQQTRVLS